MQIKYLKDAPLGAMGETAEVPDDQAQVLITLGIAKVYDEKDSDNDNGDLFEQLGDSQSNDSEPPTDQKPSETETTESTADDQEPSKADEVNKQVQEVAENTLAEPADLAETTKPKKTKTKKTDTENN